MKFNDVKIVIIFQPETKKKKDTPYIK